MLVPYLLVFNSYVVLRQDIVDYLDTRREVKNWFAFLPSAIVMISEEDVHKLSLIIRERFSNMNFILTKIERNENNGWLNKAVWDFINNPISSGRWDYLSFL